MFCLLGLFVYNVMRSNYCDRSTVIELPGIFISITLALLFRVLLHRILCENCVVGDKLECIVNLVEA